LLPAPGESASAPAALNLVLIVLSVVHIPLGFFLPDWIAGRILPASAGSQGGPEPGILRLVISDAIFEAIAIYGLVGKFTGMQPMVSCGLMLLGLILLLLNTARVGSWVKEGRLGRER